MPPPRLLAPAPLPPLALLPEKVLLVTVNVPLLEMPPPMLLALLPLAMVRFAICVAPDKTAITSWLPPPSRVMPGEVVGPVMVKLASVIVGNVLTSEIVPMTLKLMVSVPVPGVVQVDPDVGLPLAALIASRRLQLLATPLLSFSVLTV